MGYRGKLITNHLCIDLPDEFVKKYDEGYHIGKDKNGKGYLNISSRRETKSHFDIIDDLNEVVKNCGFDVWAIILMEDGVVYRHNLTTFEDERIGNGEHEN